MVEYRTLASGSVASLDVTGKVLWIERLDAYQPFGDGPFCHICDGLGHGAENGLRPCPLEDSGRWDPDERY